MPNCRSAVTGRAQYDLVGHSRAFVPIRTESSLYTVTSTRFKVRTCSPSGRQLSDRQRSGLSPQGTNVWGWRGRLDSGGECLGRSLGLIYSKILFSSNTLTVQRCVFLWRGHSVQINPVSKALTLLMLDNLKLEQQASTELLFCTTCLSLYLSMKSESYIMSLPLLYWPWHVLWPECCNLLLAVDPSANWAAALMKLVRPQHALHQHEPSTFSAWLIRLCAEHY